MRLKRSFYLVPRENLTGIVVSSVTTAYIVTTGITFQAATPWQILTRIWRETNNWTDHVPNKIFHTISIISEKVKSLWKHL